MQIENQKTNPIEVTLSGKESVSQELTQLISAMKEGDVHILEANYDFSTDLIEVVKRNFSQLPLKANMIEEGPSRWKIKVKYPADGESCCGCCG